MELFRLIIIKPITSKGFDEIYGLEYYIYMYIYMKKSEKSIKKKKKEKK